MWKVLTVVAASVLMVAGAHAGEDTKKDKILRLMAMDGAETVVDQVITQRLPLVRQQVTIKHPDLPAEAVEAYVQAFGEEMHARRREFIALVVPVYDRLFTSAEIDRILAFYGSDVGRKLRAATGEILTAARAAGRTWGEQHGPAVEAAVRARVESRGFKIE